jgi:hypothetical protein
MPVTRPGSPATVSLAIGQTLVVTADVGSIGAVTRVGTAHVVRIVPGAPVHIGRPGAYCVKADTGVLAYDVRDPLSAGIAAGVRNIQSFRIIQHALIQGQHMALRDKFAQLAERTKTVPAALDAAATSALDKLDAVEARGGMAFANLDSVVSDANAAVAIAEDAVNQLTNGGPE